MVVSRVFFVAFLCVALCTTRPRRAHAVAQAPAQGASGWVHADQREDGDNHRYPLRYPQGGCCQLMVLLCVTNYGKTFSYIKHV